MQTEKKKLRVFPIIMYVFLVVAFGYMIYVYRDQLYEIGQVFKEGVWYIMVFTVLVLAATIYNQAAIYDSIYSILEIPSERHEMVPLYLVRRFVMVAAPSGGFSGWAPFLKFAHSRDIAVGGVFFANLIYTVLWYSSFLVFLFVGLLFLFLSHDLQWFEISAALVMLVADIIMIIGLVLIWTAPKKLEKILNWAATRVEKLNGLVRSKPLHAERRVNTFLTDMNEGVDLMREAGWRSLKKPVLHAFINETLLLFMFFLTALAFNQHLGFGVLVAAYSVSVLFYVVSPTPGGLGFVEGTLILVLQTLGVEAHYAVVITLAYRGITFWLPFISGFASLRWFAKMTTNEST